MTLKTNNGKITYHMRAGSDWVQAKMSVEDAEKLIANGKAKDSDERCGIVEKCVDDKFFFPYEVEKTAKKSKSSKG